ncbi:ATP-binding protein [Acidovorax sp. Root219]|uniref:ATP-binding protein n=1 Tax=Acidovorax sp. Root219 TaxID=1736493 RepID=UPI00070D37D0|nr:ATP-binding protein [Acidovorax sp. Root219]
MTTDQGSDGQETQGTTQAAPSGTSPELTGGQGFSFEDAVSSVYVAALLCETTAPGLPGRVVRHVSVQQGSFGQPLDDLIVRAEGADQVAITFSAQVKRRLVISAASSNADFRETIERAYETLSDAGFQVALDRLAAIVGEISDAAKRNFETLCEWARAESSSEQFVAKLQTEGVAGEKLSQFEAVRDILSSKVASGEIDAATHKLLSHFVLIRLDLLTEGSPSEAQTVAGLAGILAPIDRSRADDLWRRLLALVRVSQGRAAGYDRKTLVARLNGAFRLAGAPSAQGALQAIQQESQLAAAEIANSISGLSVPRDASVQAVVEAAASPGFVQIAGMPGAGKSVVLRSAIEQLASSGTVLFLKSDRLRGSTWAQYAAAAGMTHGSLEELLVEVSASGGSVLFVDGIDRVEVEHRSILLDLLNTIQSSPLLSGWCVVATVRDTGIEPLRTWLPAQLFSRGVRTLTIDSFDDEEAEALAQAKPALRSLLFGSDSVRAVVRRPFFAAVLAKEVDSSNAQATSEVDLAALWWERGGYGADPTRVGYRRNVLVQLAKTGAHQLGRRIPIADVDALALVELEADGIVRPVRRGHTVQFSHDIFFEWSFLQHLVRADDAWPEVIREIGEPPALGRVVELLSQTELARGDSWAERLAALEGNQRLRSQWLRAWMVGPFSLETFAQYSAVFDRAMLNTAYSRVRKVVVWYQAEKTTPNASVLAQSDAPDLDLARRMLYADIWGHPSDVAAWARFCDWLLDHASEIPTNVIPDVVSAFEVWQNMFSHYRNPVSERIVQTCLAWLYHVEHQRHRREFSRERGVWAEIEEWRDGLDELESALRTLVLNSSLTQGHLVTQYLRDLSRLEQMPRQAVKSVFTHSPFLARACPSELVDFTLSVVRKHLPVVVKKKMRGGDHLVPHSFGHFEWDHLSIDDHFSFFPAAPTREPFHSLLQQAPDQGRRLVREVANHAIRSWRQLHRLSHERDETPIPFVMQFPWGRQVFWGDSRLYLGARGYFGPSAVNSGWMALEAWAFRELEKGTPVDDVLKATLEGNQSVGALAVAAAIALQAQHTSASTWPLATNQRLWHWDIRRQVEDMTQTANLIGFITPQDRPHGLAVKKSNELPVRRADIRSLGTLMVLRGGELGEQASARIQGFPGDLPFDYAEQRDNAEVRSDLAETAEIWAEIGKRENYRAELSPDESNVVISHENPKATSEDIQALQARHMEMGRYLSLLNWAHSYFDDGKLKESLTLEAAATAAMELDSEDLFETGHEYTELAHQRQSAVAGVAAILMLEKSEPHLQWAVDVCTRAARTPEVPQPFFSRTMKLMHHPVLYATKGLGALLAVVEDDGDVQSLQSLLTELCADPYEEIAVAAFGALMGAWPKYPDIAWAAIRLATALALYEVQYGLEGDPESRHYARIEGVVAKELQRLQDRARVLGALPTWPDPWVQITEGEAVQARRRRGRTVDAGWRVNPMHVDTAFLEKVLKVIPLEAALADPPHAGPFLDWCEGLANWTIVRIAPAWARSRRDLDDTYGPDYFEWRRHLYRFLSQIALRVPIEEGTRRFLEPAMATNDETFASLGECFTDHLIAQMADSPEIPRTALALLSSVTQRVLAYQGWSHDAHGGYSGQDFVGIVKHLFFADLGYAGGAVRFANRNWAEVETVIPIFEPILRAHGSVAFVARSWMNLCESSFAHYPIQHFVDNIEHLLAGEGTPPGWRSTQLPGRLSGLIQRFSERQQPMPLAMSQKLLRALDRLVDMGDRRAAAVQLSEVFRSVRVTN